MLFFYSVPKPFIGEFDFIQQQAIESWKLITPHITLLGDEVGVSQIANTLQVAHNPHIAKNEFGTPLLSSVFETIRAKHSADDLVCFINCDIVLSPSNFITTIDACKTLNDFLAIGKRVDLDCPSDIKIDKIIKEAKTKGVDHGWGGIDYFVFRAHSFQFVYPFAIGKFVWDQWLVGNALRRGMRIIDCSSTILAVHLNASWYQHHKVVTNRTKIEESEEAKRNLSFDHYLRDILSGSTHYTIASRGDVVVEQKCLESFMYKRLTT